MDNAASDIKLGLNSRRPGLYDSNVRFYLDTVPTDPGPEFLVFIPLEYVGDDHEAVFRNALFRVDEFPRQDGYGGRPVACEGVSGHGTNEGDVQFILPRGCLQIDEALPGEVRFSARVSYILGPNIWFPKQRRFSPWVGQS